MANIRSRNYPSVDLGGALAMAHKAYTQDGRNKLSRLALAKHLGNESLSGPALSKIGLLRAYGLIEGSGDDLRITDLADTVEAPQGSPERAEALRRLALEPTLFQQIRKEFPTPPSEASLPFSRSSEKISSDWSRESREGLSHYFTPCRRVRFRLYSGL